MSAYELDRRCTVLYKGKEEYSELECVQELYQEANVVIPYQMQCISSDFTDARVDIPQLLRYRNGKKQKMGKPLLSYFRRAFRIPTGVLISVCVKNEARLLLMSIVWHLLQGADHYFICDNSASTSVVSHALQPLVEAGLVTVKKYPGVAVQKSCYDDALAFGKENGFKWQGGLDADEFLVLPSNFTSIELALEQLSRVSLKHGRKVGAVAFNWILQPGINQSAVHYPEDVYTTPAEKQNFFIDERNIDRHVKSFALINVTLSWSHVHMPLKYESINYVAVNSGGTNLLSVGSMFASEPVVKNGALIHFRYRTIQELAAKRERGRATLDCDSHESKNNSHCETVHKARESRKIVTDLATEHGRHCDVPYNGTDIPHDSRIRHLLDPYEALAVRVRSLLSGKG